MPPSSPHAVPSGVDAASGNGSAGLEHAPREFPDIAELSYEAARDELTGIVATLEAGNAGLEESMRLWARGEALARHCTTWLDQAEATMRATDPDVE